MGTRIGWLLATAAVAGGALIALLVLRNPVSTQALASTGQPAATMATSAIKGIPSDAIVIDTAHYRIHATASRKHATALGDALEAVHDAYTDLFPIRSGAVTSPVKRTFQK